MWIISPSVGFKILVTLHFASHLSASEMFALLRLFLRSDSSEVERLSNDWVNQKLSRRMKACKRSALIAERGSWPVDP